MMPLAIATHILTVLVLSSIIVITSLPTIGSSFTIMKGSLQKVKAKIKEGNGWTTRLLAHSLLI